MIAINTSSLAYHIYDMDIGEALEVFDRLGFKALEISHSYPLEILQKYSSKFDYVGYHHFTQKKLDTEFDELREEIGEPLKMCGELDVGLFSFHPFYEDDRERAARNLKELDAQIEPKLCIENLLPDQSHALLQSPRDLEKIKETWNSIGVLLDVGHAYQHGSLKEFLTFQDDIFEVHLQDVSEDGEQEHLPLGSGCIDFSFLETLKNKTWTLDLKHGDEDLIRQSRIKAEDLKI